MNSRPFAPSIPRRRGRPASLLALFVLAALAWSLAVPGAGAQYIYGLTQDGRLAVNGAVLDKLPSGYSSGSGVNGEQRWWALDVVGADRHALRLDGKLFKNGSKYVDLPYNPALINKYWVGLDVLADDVHALSEAGLYSKNGVSVVNYTEFDAGDKIWPFTAVLATPPDAPSNGAVLCLRRDGAVFSGLSADVPVLKFTGGTGPYGESDGETAFSSWIGLAYDAMAGKVYALRSDGKIQQANVDFGNPLGTPFAALPIVQAPTPANIYIRMSFSPAGELNVLRQDGAMFIPVQSILVPSVDYAGDGNSSAQSFFAFGYLDGSQYALRYDGRLFRDDDPGSSLFKLPNSGYFALALSNDPPDLTTFKNPQPKVARYAIKTVEGHSVTAPVLATDIELLPQQIAVTPNGDLPEGISLDEVPVVGGGALHELSIASAGPLGKTTTKLLVSDGVTKPVKVAYPVVVKALDTDPLKNRKPMVSKLKLVQALVGFETVIPILADDVDEDPLTYTVNETKYPFTAGATFGLEEGQPVFRWTPAFEDIGKTSFQVTVSDGTAKAKLTVKLKVVGSLVAAVPAAD